MVCRRASPDNAQARHNEFAQRGPQRQCVRPIRLSGRCTRCRSSTTSCGGWPRPTCAASGRARRCRRRRSCTRRICGSPAPARRGPTSDISSASPRDRCGRSWSSARARAARRSDGRDSTACRCPIRSRSPRDRGNACCRRSTRRSSRLEAIDPEQARIVELRYLRRPQHRGSGRRARHVAGDAQAPLGLARAWLFRELSGRARR